MTILNQTYPKGRVFVEGRATVVKAPSVRHYAAVQFSVDGAEFVTDRRSERPRASRAPRSKPTSTA